MFDKVPNYTGAPFVLFQSDQLAKLQRWVRFLNHLALVLPIVSILLFAGAVLAGPGPADGAWCTPRRAWPCRWPCC